MLRSNLALWLKEDMGSGDHSSQAAISKSAKGHAQLLVKSEGIIAGIEVARELVQMTDPSADFQTFLKDGDKVKPGDIAFVVFGNALNALSIERLMLNILQRMSGIATKTHRLQQKIAHTSARLLDTRKTTPGFRMLEKQAVLIGGGFNHRFGLFDMVMLKDNHIDFCGGITKAVDQTVEYLKINNLSLKIEVEVRNEAELSEAIQLTSIDRIMLDNFTPEQIAQCIASIPERFEVEASGGINEANIVAYAETGVDFISVGALTHNVESLDLSFKAVVHS
ncbi:MAG: carboxylating nicotinate-nucleotide diphosphorylase [Bacteroidota bacterium]|jgi:nicotinate-nucleotide pyrophosphorylase (carboxylating)|nr:carboxylating nicotinate-nucleotide diphosphorylase [Flavobacteriia bacterium]NBP28770.1 carboxylating nicotinate-nucleotide diphosphorylase [Flavobacteriia bacterium]